MSEGANKNKFDSQKSDEITWLNDFSKPVNHAESIC